jgi:hypothetical protein
MKINREFFLTNKGLFSVNKFGTKEILENNKSLYLSRLVKFKNEILALTQNNKLLKIEGDKVVNPKFAGLLEGVKVLNIRMVNSRLYINSNDGILFLIFLKRILQETFIQSRF